jgi:glycogen debranching enzyme
MLQNFSDRTLELALELDLASDFRDLFDIRGYERLKRGHHAHPEAGASSCVLAYEGLDGIPARTDIVLDRPAEVEPYTVPAGDGTIGTIGATFSIPFTLAAGEAAQAQLTVSVEAGGATPAVIATGSSGDDRSHVRTSNLLLDRVLERCERDLLALETPFAHGTMPAAGIPWFVAPFGRDSLIVGLQTLHLQPESAIGTLRVLAALQGARVDPETEEEPGKILHEMRYGEMARTHEIPHRPYYGTNDATPLFAWLIAETIAWTGDQSLYAEFSPHARRAFDWMEQYGDLDGDGLIEYTTEQRGQSHIRHKVWKDSRDSLHYPDGRAASGVIAAVEVQGYAFAAYACMAEMAALFGDAGWSEELRNNAVRLRDRVESAFWIEADHCYAQALDADKQPIGTVSSNAGHLLAAGLPSADRAAQLAARMLESDLASGWGIRTLSSTVPSYNPMSYHNGSIWPHDNSLIAAGLYRYGHEAAGTAVFNALFDAALAIPDYRLPELYCGFARHGERHDRPVPYPVSCSPQAWAAGSIPLLVRSVLGLDADTRHGVVVVQPRLPDWLDQIEITQLQALGQTGSLRVSRIEGGYEVESSGLTTRLVPS